MPNTLTPTHPRKATRSRSRRGSILIFVVGVLVLLAVIATAYLATSRNDRVSTQQNAYNTQVDLLLQGVVNAAKATIVGDLFDANVYRPLSGSTGTPKKYDAFDMPSYWTAPPANSTTNGLASPPENTLQTDPWLAPRVPVLLDPTKPFDATPTGTPAAPANPGIWRAVSASVLPGQRFESPYRQPGFNGPLIYDNRTNLLPESVLINGRKLPAFRLNLPDDAGTIQTGVFVLAGDADGDGQADSMLFKLPVGQLAGVTYYGATRTIDNNSAVNVNTAMSRDFDFFGDQKSGIASGYFTSGVGLLEMLKTYSAQSYDSAINAYGGELTNQLLYKFNSGGGIPGVLDPGNPPTGTPFDDTGAARNDFFYRSYGDALQSQLGRRLDNPGSLDAGTKFRAFGLGDASALAARFTLRDSSGSTEPVETALNPSLLTGTRGTPYVADDANTVGTNGWFDSLFNYTKENSLASATFLPRRALLVTDNPLSNLASPLKTAAGGLPPTASTSAGTLAQMTAIPADGIVNKVPINGQRPLLTDPNYTRDNFSDAWRAYWSVMAEPDFTGTGDDLGTSFSPIYAAMKTAKGPNYYQNPYIGTEFFSEYVAPAVPPAPPVTGAPYDPVTTATDDTAAGMGPAGAPEQHPNRMFRSPLRATAIAAGGDATAPPTWNNETARLPSDQVVLLRSAIAAINLQSAREQSDAIGTNTVRLAVNVAGAQKFAQATVFGQKRQPFISEIYAQTDNVAPGPGGGQANPHGYIAIELVNPYPVAFDLQYCRLATLQRLRETSSADAADRYPNMQLRDRSAFGGMAATAQVDLGDTTGTTVKSNLADPTAFSSPMIIAPGGTLLLENYDASATDPDAARYRPVSSGLPATGPIANNAAPYQQANVVYVHNLHKLFDKEVVLMRPLGAGIGQTTVAAKPGTDTVQFQVTGTEGSPPILRFAPLDSYDFSGLILPGAPPDTDLPTPAVALTVTKATAWHYVRDVVNDNGFRAIYPGRYDANQSDEQRHPRQDTAGSFLPRQQGTDSAVAWTPGTETDQWDPASMAVPTNTAAPGPPDPPPSLGLPSDIASYPQTFTIHLALPFWPAGNNLQAVPNNIYPFGKFAKNSDLLQVPYIGGYVIRLEEYLNETISAGSNAHVLEVNAVTADSAFAEDTDPNDNPSLNTPESGLQAREQIGRFAPLAQSATAGGECHRHALYRRQLHHRLAADGFERQSIRCHTGRQHHAAGCGAVQRFCPRQHAVALPLRPQAVRLFRDSIPTGGLLPQCRAAAVRVYQPHDRCGDGAADARTRVQQRAGRDAGQRRAEG